MIGNKEKCECGTEMIAEKIESIPKLLLDLKKQEFVSSEALYKIKKVSNQSNSPAADPSLKCQAKYDPETDQAIVFLNCKGLPLRVLTIPLKSI